MKIDVKSWIQKGLWYNIHLRSQIEKWGMGKFDSYSIIIGVDSGKQ